MHLTYFVCVQSAKTIFPFYALLSNFLYNNSYKVLKFFFYAPLLTFKLMQNANLLLRAFTLVYLGLQGANTF